MNEKNISQEQVISPEKEKELKIPFQKSLENVVSVLKNTADKSPQERLEALRPIGGLSQKCSIAIRNALDKISKEEKEKGWDGSWDTHPKELEIHDLRNALSHFLPQLKILEKYELLEKYQEIGDSEPERMIKEYKKAGKELSKDDLRNIEKYNFRHPIANFTETSHPYQSWDRRTFTPNDQIELSKLYKNALEEFTYRILGRKYVSDECIKSVEKNLLPKYYGTDRSLKGEMGPEAYDKAIKILNEEFDKLEEKK